MSDSRLVEWVRRAQSGDQKAREFLYLFLRERLMPYVVRRLHDEGRAQDVLHDTFLAFLSDPDALCDSEKFLQYEARIISRRIEHEIIRSAGTGRALDAVEASYQDPSEHNLEAEEWYLALLHELAPTDRELFRLLYVFGVSTAEGNDILGISPGNFRLQKHRLAAKIQDLILRFRT